MNSSGAGWERPTSGVAGAVVVRERDGVVVGVAVGAFVGALVGVFVAGSRPFPVKATLCGLSRALSVMLRLALRGPPPVGAKLTLMAQLLPTAMDAPVQVLGAVESPA